MQHNSKPQQPQPNAGRPAPGSLEDLNVTAPATSDAAGGTNEAGDQPEKDANNRERRGLENQSVTKPAPIDVERRQ